MQSWSRKSEKRNRKFFGFILIPILENYVEWLSRKSYFLYLKNESLLKRHGTEYPHATNTYALYKHNIRHVHFSCWIDPFWDFNNINNRFVQKVCSFWDLNIKFKQIWKTFPTQSQDNRFFLFNYIQLLNSSFFLDVSLDGRV